MRVWRRTLSVMPKPLRYRVQVVTAAADSTDPVSPDGLVASLIGDTRTRATDQLGASL